ncbi:MAG: zinc ribbon domain-containing protein [Gaiellaceae bacterium]
MRFPLFGRFRGESGTQATQASPSFGRRAPSPGALRRERRAILRAREELIRDVGGLALEMYRRDQFREDLLAERCRDIVDLEVRLSELDSMLAAAAAGRRAAGRCSCGAPILWGSHFCGNCGRPVGAEPVVACRSCGHPLPADAEFCPSCGTAAEEPPAPEESASGESDATVVRPGTGALPWES